MLRNRGKLSLNSETKNYFLRASQSQEEREAYRALAKERNELNSKLDQEEPKQIHTWFMRINSFDVLI